MPKVDSETGEPMSDDPSGPEDQAGSESNPREQRKPDDADAGGGSS